MYEEPNEADADLRLLIRILPKPLQEAIDSLPHGELLEVVLDLGRLPEARLPARTVKLSETPVDLAELQHVVTRVGMLTDDNRAGIERTLHRISAIRNRRGEVVGLTLRVGRAVFGTIDMLRDLVEGGLNILILGRPGVGKTTKLREMARVLADDLHKRVMIVDTSNEIGGDGDIPHPGIGGARRMQVSRPDRQHSVMIEAVENHMPEAIVIDEIGTEAEAAAARTIAERGVQLIGTAHGNTLENLVLNPTLSDLVGGVHTVTLGDEEARRRGTQKTVNERRAPPTFDIVVEMVGRDEVLVHRDTAAAVDRLLAGEEVGGERRRQHDGKVETEEVARAAAEVVPAAPVAPATRPSGPVKIHPYALSRDLLHRVIRDLGASARVVDRLDHADMILALRSRADDPRVRHTVERTGAQVHVLKRNSSSEMRRVLRNALFVIGGLAEEEVRETVAETEHAIQRAMSEGVAVPLSPKPPGLRRLQHRLAVRYHLDATSVGSEPSRHLVILPPGASVREGWEQR